MVARKIKHCTHIISFTAQIYEDQTPWSTKSNNEITSKFQSSSQFTSSQIYVVNQSGKKQLGGRKYFQHFMINITILMPDYKVISSANLTNWFATSEWVDHKLKQRVEWEKKMESIIVIFTYLNHRFSQTV